MHPAWSTAIVVLLAGILSCLVALLRRCERGFRAIGKGLVDLRSEAHAMRLQLADIEAKVIDTKTSADATLRRETERREPDRTGSHPAIVT